MPQLLGQKFYSNPRHTALITKLSSHKAFVAHLQKKPTASDSSQLKKPADPPKEGEKQTVTLNGVLLHYWQKCFCGNGSWNKTHTTEEHIIGAGIGYKGSKVKDPPLPGKKTPANADATAHLAAQNVNDGSTNRFFFCLRLWLLVILAISLLINYVITNLWPSFFLSSKRWHSTLFFIHLSIGYCNKCQGHFYNCITLGFLLLLLDFLVYTIL